MPCRLNIFKIGFSNKSKWRISISISSKKGLGKTKKLIEDDENIPNKKTENETERVENLDYFLNDDEINRDR